jgi:hypothetical protein
MVVDPYKARKKYTVTEIYSYVQEENSDSTRKFVIN